MDDATDLGRADSRLDLRGRGARQDLVAVLDPPPPAFDGVLRRARRRRQNALGAVAVAVLVLIGAGGFALAGDDETRLTADGPTTTADAPVAGEETVPDVVGSTVGRARRTMSDAGLLLSVSPGDPSVDGAVILATEPGASSGVTRGAVVGARTALPDPPSTSSAQRLVTLAEHPGPMLCPRSTASAGSLPRTRCSRGGSRCGSMPSTAASLNRQRSTWASGIDGRTQAAGNR